MKMRWDMKITISNHGSTFSVDLPEDSDMEQTLTAIKGLLISCGFHPATVDQYVLANEWGLES